MSFVAVIPAASATFFDMAIDLPQGGFDDQFKILVRSNKLLQKLQLFLHFGYAKNTSILSLGCLMVKSRQICCCSQSSLDFCMHLVLCEQQFSFIPLLMDQCSSYYDQCFESWCSVNREHCCLSSSWPSLSSEHISNFHLHSEGKKSLSILAIS